MNDVSRSVGDLRDNKCAGKERSCWETTAADRGGGGGVGGCRKIESTSHGYKSLGYLI